MTKKKYISFIPNFFRMSFHSFFGPDIQVRISDLGKNVLDNKTLASKIADVIIHNKARLENGDQITVADDNGGISVSLSTTIKEEPVQKSK